MYNSSASVTEVLL